MQEVLALALSSMNRDAARLERVGMNLANALTPAYKREVVVELPFAQMVDSLSTKTSTEVQMAPALVANNIGGALLVQTDARPGTLKLTRQSLDVSLSGPGFFEIATDSGPAYTRQGSFHLDGRGRLVTAQGFPVMGKGGEIVLSQPDPVIDAAGNVFDGKKTVGSTPVAQLKVVQFEHPKNLQRLGNGLVLGDQSLSQMVDADINIRQGYLENSNVNSMHEMVQLMQTMRHFESMQKMALGYDEMMGTAIRRLGEIS